MRHLIRIASGLAVVGVMAVLPVPTVRFGRDETVVAILDARAYGR